MTPDAGELMALRKRLADEITLFSKDKHMLLKLIDDRIAASQPDREAVAWRIKPSDTLFLIGETITDEPAVAEIWRKAGCEVEALSLLSVQVDGEQKETHATKPSPSSTSATATETAVLDLLGPMLDAWDSLSNDEHVRISKIAPDFTLHLVAVRAAADSTNQPLPQTHAKTDAGLVSGARP